VDYGLGISCLGLIFALDRPEIVDTELESGSILSTVYRIAFDFPPAILGQKRR